MKKIFIILIIILITVTIGITVTSKVIATDIIKTIEIKNINLEEIKDDKYIGSYETTLVKATVSVEVESGEIIDIIILKHECGIGYKAEDIIKSVINKQTLNVDSISGATVSSEVLLKATEQALLQGK